jgi:Flp pilus assembly protein TadG
MWPARNSGTTKAQRLLQAFCRDCRGATAMIFTVALPLTLGLIGVAADYASWSSQHQKLQKGADAAALAAASELSISSANETRVTAVAQSVVRSNIPVAEGDSAVDVAATVLANRNGVKVVLRQKKKAIMSALVTPTLTDMEVSATATMSGNRKVCIVALETTKSHALDLDGSAKVTANDCAVFSNSKKANGLRVKSASVLSAPFICSAGGYETQGTIIGTRVADCPAQPDPLASRPPPSVGPCVETQKLVIETDRTLAPGAYCGGIEIKKNAKVTLSSGIYVIKDGELKVDDTATLYGRNVSFYFTGNNAKFDFLSSATVNLGAPKDGPMAGILFFGDRNADDLREYKITSDNARILLGTLYIPNGVFTIDAKSPVADQSAYTAVVARRIDLKHSPNLTLNTSYYATDVPVPEGLGPSSNVRLVQ